MSVFKYKLRNVDLKQGSSPLTDDLIIGTHCILCFIFNANKYLLLLLLNHDKKVFV